MTTFWSEEDDSFICIVEKYPSLSTFGKTAKTAENDMVELVNFCEDWIAEDNEEIS